MECLTHRVCCTNSVYNEWCAFPWSLMHSPSCLRQWKGILNVSRVPLQWLSQTQRSSASTQRGRKRNKMEGETEEEGRGILCVPPFLRHHGFLLSLAPFSLSLSLSWFAQLHCLRFCTLAVNSFIYAFVLHFLHFSINRKCSVKAWLHPNPHKPSCTLNRTA